MFRPCWSSSGRIFCYTVGCTYTVSENVPLLSSSVERYLLLCAVRVCTAVHTLTADRWPRRWTSRVETCRSFLRKKILCILVHYLVNIIFVWYSARTWNTLNNSLFLPRVLYIYIRRSLSSSYDIYHQRTLKISKIRPQTENIDECV
jgi:hypothetical protein